MSARLRARARSVFSRWWTQRVFELLSLAVHAKTFMVESALVRRIQGGLDTTLLRPRPRHSLGLSLPG